MSIFVGDTAPSKIFVGDTEVSKVFLGDTQVRPSGWQPGANTLWYINLDQSNSVFTDAKGHTVTNDGIVYNASGVLNGCGYGNANARRILSQFNSNESFPSSFTIMAFIKPTGNHYTNDHPMGIVLSDAVNKRLWGIGFTQTNTAVQFNYLNENVAWYNFNASPSSGIILNTRHHYALTYNGMTMVGYIDGIQKISNNVSGSGSGGGPTGGLSLFGRYRGNLIEPYVTNTIQGYVDEAICENKVWAQQEIQDYLANISY